MSEEYEKSVDLATEWLTALGALPGFSVLEIDFTQEEIEGMPWSHVLPWGKQ